jgi:hypothetical protein
LKNWSEIKEPWWSDRPVLIVGTGGSLKGFDFKMLDGLGYILAVKEAVWDLPFADLCFGLDLNWIERRKEDFKKLTMPIYLAAPVDSHEKCIDIESAFYLKRRRRANGLSEMPNEIESGGNSGFGALNVAVLKKARSIYLFGFDYGGAHYCVDRYSHLPAGHNAKYLPTWGTNFVAALPQLKRLGVEVTNASPNSSVSAFKKCSIDEAIGLIKNER